jgi:hypothetical protein
MYKNLLIIIISLILGLNLLSADSDNPNYNIKDEETGTGNEPSEDYKVKDFYGTWVFVAIRLEKCPYTYIPDFKLEYLGKKIIIKPNYYQNTISDKYNNSSTHSYLGVNNAFYSIEITARERVYGYDSHIRVARSDDPKDFNESLLVLNKDQNYHDYFGDYDQLNIKDKNHLIYFENIAPNSINDTFILYLLIKEEEAKKLDKYSIYVPTRLLDDAEYDNDGKTIIKKATLCGKKYDEYANKLISDGKYNVIRDNKLAYSNVDIE